MGQRHDVRSDSIVTDMVAMHYTELHRSSADILNTIVSMIKLED